MNASSSAEKLAWYWHRLRAMEPGEIAHRVAAKAKRIGKGDPAQAVADFHLSAPVAGWPRLPDREAASSGVREAARLRAAEIRSGNWKIFGWRETRIEGTPRWHHDYLNDVAIPCGQDASLDHRCLPGGASTRAVWEANRWAEMVTLAQNAWLNGACGDARLAQTWLDDWCDHNTTGSGINWSSALEAAIRLMNFCWLDALIRDCGDAELAATQQRLAQRIVPGHAHWIWQQRSAGSSANNHLVGELAALVAAARRWPCLMSVSCCAERAWSLLVAEVPRQFFDDGGNREQALHYHLFAWEWIWHAHRAMRGADPAIAGRLARGAQFFCDASHAGAPWDFGDSDDAQIVPLFADRGRASVEWKAWMLANDPQGTISFWLGPPPEDVRAIVPASWKLFPDSGIAIQETAGWKARLDASALGFGSLAAHGHLDALHLSLWHANHAVVIDPGTGGYYGDEALRAKLASWEWHNGPIPLEGREGPRRAGIFLWRDHHDSPRLEADGAVCRASLACDGPLVRRAVCFEGEAWRVEDAVVNERPHLVRWRLAPEWSLTRQVGSELVFEGPGGKKLRFAAEGADPARVSAGRDIVSPRFGQTVEAPVVTIEFRRRLVSRWRIV
jgi:hypothetical protein